MNQAENRTPGNVPEQRTYKVEDIAVMLNIGRTSAYNLVKEGHFKTVRQDAGNDTSRRCQP